LFEGTLTSAFGATHAPRPCSLATLASRWPPSGGEHRAVDLGALGSEVSECACRDGATVAGQRSLERGGRKTPELLRRTFGAGLA
jgi:hypothetical protein